MNVITAPSGPRPRPSYNLHAFLDRHLGNAFYDLMNEQRSLVFAVWERLGCEELFLFAPVFLTEDIVQDEALLHETLVRFLQQLGTLKNIQTGVTSELLESVFVADDSVIDLTTNAF